MAIDFFNDGVTLSSSRQCADLFSCRQNDNNNNNNNNNKKKKKKKIMMMMMMMIDSQR